MQLAAPHQAVGDVGRLQRRALGRRMGGEIAGDRNENVPEMPRHEPCREINLSLAVECVEEGVSDRLLVGRQIIQPLAALAWNAGRRHVEIRVR